MPRRRVAKVSVPIELRRRFKLVIGALRGRAHKWATGLPRGSSPAVVWVDIFDADDDPPTHLGTYYPGATRRKRWDVGGELDGLRAKILPAIEDLVREYVAERARVERDTLVRTG